MDKVLFTGKMKLADLISANHNLLLMLPRLGVPLGFGDKKVSEVCAKYNIPPDFFLLICNVYSFDSYIPSRDEVIATDMSMLIPYLRASHRFYMDERLPHIEQHLSRIADDTDKKYGMVLMRFFASYKDEIAEHFLYEEENVFPYMESLATGEPSGSMYRIRDFEQAHHDIEDKLTDLVQIIFKYLPGGSISQSDSINVVFDIFQLSSDLSKHSLIEEKVLVSYVKLLEKKLV